MDEFIARWGLEGGLRVGEGAFSADGPEDHAGISGKGRRGDGLRRFCGRARFWSLT